MELDEITVGEAVLEHPANSRFWRHVQHPCNQGTCNDASATSVGVGSCGDRLQVDLSIQGDTIQSVKCLPQGCLYTVACASAMSVLATGLSIDDALKLQPDDVEHELDELPEDHRHCARLAINTLGEAIAEYYRMHHADL
jgi:nitrogen fixation NifU-like protein